MSVKIVNGNKQISHPVSEDLYVKQLNVQVAEKMNIKNFSLRKDLVYLSEGKLVSIYLTTDLTLSKGTVHIPIQINDITFQMTMDKSDSAEKLSEKVSPNISIGELKKRMLTKVNDKSGKAEDWHLTKNSEILQDGGLLKNHIDEKIFIVVLTPIQPFDVMVKLSEKDVRNYTVSAHSEMTIREFKKVCSEKIGQPANNYVLSYNGEFLEIPEDGVLQRLIKFCGATLESNDEKREKLAERTLGSYGIAKLSVLHVITTMPGGEAQ